MGLVVAFKPYAKDRTMIDITEPCDRPFHRKEYIYLLEEGHECLRCGVSVVEAHHPSFGEETKWYG